jgi:hypothetical protein
MSPCARLFPALSLAASSAHHHRRRLWKASFEVIPNPFWRSSSRSM